MIFAAVLHRAKHMRENIRIITVAQVEEDESDVLVSVLVVGT